MDRNVADRIQKLLTLAEDPAASANEKAVARRKAEMLMMRHQITEADVEQAAYVVRTIEHDTYSRFPGWYKEIGRGVGAFLGVFPVYQSGTGRSGNGTFIVGGEAHDIEVFAYMVESLRHKIMHLAATYRDRTGASRAETNAYRVGAAVRVSERLDNLMRRVTRRQRARGSTALVRTQEVEQKRMHAERAVREQLNVRRDAGTTYRSEHAFQHGHRDGASIDVRKGTSSGDPNRLSS